MAAAKKAPKTQETPAPVAIIAPGLGDLIGELVDQVPEVDDEMKNAILNLEVAHDRYQALMGHRAEPVRVLQETS